MDWLSVAAILAALIAGGASGIALGIRMERRRMARILDAEDLDAEIKWGEREDGRYLRKNVDDNR